MTSFENLPDTSTELATIVQTNAVLDNVINWLQQYGEQYLTPAEPYENHTFKLDIGQDVLSRADIFNIWDACTITGELPGMIDPLHFSPAVVELNFFKYHQGHTVAAMLIEFSKGEAPLVLNSLAHAAFNGYGDKASAVPGQEPLTVAQLDDIQKIIARALLT